MPKLKSNSGASKRFKVTKRGKVLAKRAKMRHILTSKDRKTKRHKRQPLVVDSANRRLVKRLIPYAF
ncbi:MAG: 50S ribosomal protein L35 [Myxococcales bacterium]|nr:50S ribosomal protein L35 [Myxococcales bacterium]